RKRSVIAHSGSPLHYKQIQIIAHTTSIFENKNQHASSVIRADDIESLACCLDLHAAVILFDI
ncbi:flagella basal body P-ring formation protein FlgA, partial [Erwinia amylovora]|nr:flagella basal body P-ring formation protein FlgA [Erwinia amylovora]